MTPGNLRRRQTPRVTSLLLLVRASTSPDCHPLALAKLIAIANELECRPLGVAARTKPAHILDRGSELIDLRCGKESCVPRMRTSVSAGITHAADRSARTKQAVLVVW